MQWRWEFGSPRDLGQMDIWISKEGVPWGVREVGEFSDGEEYHWRHVGLHDQGGNPWGPGKTWGEGGSEDTQHLGVMVWKAAAQGQGLSEVGGDKGCPRHLLLTLQEDRAMQAVAAISGSCP